MTSILQPWIIGVLVSIIGMAITITVGIQGARSQPVPIWDREDFWLLISLPSVACALACVFTQTRFYPSLVVSVGTTISHVGGLVIVWLDATARSAPGGMNPFSGGGIAMTLGIVAIFQWVLFFFTLSLAGLIAWRTRFVDPAKH